MSFVNPPYMKTGRINPPAIVFTGIKFCMLPYINTLITTAK